MIGAAIRSLGRQYLDPAWHSGRDFRVRIVERPGLRAHNAALTDLTAILRSVAARRQAAGGWTVACCRATGTG